MTTLNAAAAIGYDQSVTVEKIPSIGVYVQDTTVPGPGSDGPYFGVQGLTYWDRNWLGEDAGFVAPSTSGALGTTNVPAWLATPADVGTPSGKKAQWTTSGLAAITVPADGRMTVTAGTAVAASGTGLYKSFIAPATVIPIGSWFWTFEV